jgi:uncharacterized membrane protein (DUF485 family)
MLRASPSGVTPFAFQLETEIIMKSIISSAIMVLATAPAFAAVQVVPAPAIGLGIPAAVAVIVVGLVALLLKRRKA